MLWLSNFSFPTMAFLAYVRTNLRQDDLEKLMLPGGCGVPMVIRVIKEKVDTNGTQV